MRARIAASLAAAAVMLTACGCRTPEPAPGGPYEGRADLYAVDVALVGAVDVLDTFLQWEYNHRAELADLPEVTAAADRIRRRAPALIADAVRLRDVLERNPTAEAARSAKAATEALRAMAAEALEIMRRQAK